MPANKEEPGEWLGEEKVESGSGTLPRAACLSHLCDKQGTGSLRCDHLLCPTESSDMQDGVYPA